MLEELKKETILLFDSLTRGDIFMRNSAFSKNRLSHAEPIQEFRTRLLALYNFSNSNSPLLIWKNEDKEALI